MPAPQGGPGRLCPEDERRAPPPRGVPEYLSAVSFDPLATPEVGAGFCSRGRVFSLCAAFTWARSAAVIFLPLPQGSRWLDW